MALVLPLLLLLVVGIIDFGRAFNNHIIITNAAREGARAASRFPKNAGLIETATIQEAFKSGVDLTSDSIDIEGLYSEPGQTIRVTVTYQFDTILGGFVGADSLTLSSSTAMVVFGFEH